MWEIVDGYVTRHKMFTSGDRILVGVSGGADSVCLVRYLLDRSLDLRAVHINHMLRGPESDRDEAFVRSFCKEQGIPLTVRRVDVGWEASQRGLGLEETGRMLRYRIFSEIAKREDCHKIAVGHHADDQAETLLFHIARGTGLDGMCGIAPVNKKVIRPLLCLSKKEILVILERLGQNYVTDSSNQEEHYRRNYIRNRILPLFGEINPKAVEHISSLAEKMRKLSVLVENRIDSLWERHAIVRQKGWFLPETAWEEISEYETEALLLKMMEKAAGKRKDLSAVHVTAVKELLLKPEGKRQNLPYGLVAVREGKGLYIGEKEEELPRDSVDLTVDLTEGVAQLMIPGEEESFFFNVLDAETYFKNAEKNDYTAFFDYDKIKSRIHIRTKKSGDYLVIDQAGHKKKLRRYFIDHKIPASAREEMLLLAEGSHVLWIVGERISEAYKVTEHTQTVLRVQKIRRKSKWQTESVF